MDGIFPSLLPPNSPRPQSHRFVQETLHKLTQDSIRAGAQSVAATEASRQTTPATCLRPVASPGETSATGPSPRRSFGQRTNWPDINDLRVVVREEVAEAVHNGIPHALEGEGWSAQFSNWRKADDHVVRQIRGQLGELEDANRELISFLNEYITTSEFAQFRVAMNKYSTLVDELSDSRQGNESVLLSTVEHVVEKAVSAATSNLGQLIEEKMATQVTLHAEEQQRQITKVLERVEAYASQVSRQFENQDVVLQDKLGSVMQDIGTVMQNRMQDSAQEIASSTLQAAKEGALNMKKVTTTEIEKLRSYMERVFAGFDQEVGEEDEGLIPLMRIFSDLLTQGVSTNEQAENWHQTAVHADHEMQAARQGYEKKCFETEELRQKLLNLEENFRKKSEELEGAERSLAKPWPWTKYTSFLDDIVAGGRVKMDFYEEWVEIIGGMNFETRKPNQAPTAALLDVDAAEAALSDTMEILACFGEVSVTVESHVKSAKGKADFWEAIALNRAELVRDLLEAKGVPYRRMTAVGLYGKTGMDRNAIMLRLKLFPKQEASPKASPRGKKK